MRNSFEKLPSTIIKILEADEEIKNVLIEAERQCVRNLITQ